jgi:hypothetical protein
MAYGHVFSVKLHRIALIDALKYFREGCISRLDQKMNMVRHQNIGIEEKGATVLIAFQKVEVFLEVGGAFKDFLPLIASCDDVIKGSLKLNPWLPCHGMRVPKPKSIVNISIFQA